MWGQPRCREWTPLATQQLRLRSLLQIVGYNLYGNEGCSQSGSLYYTLHSTTMSAPFYTSEKLLSNHPKWREIDSELIHKMSSLNVVVRVWKHIRNEDKVLTDNSSNSTLRHTDKIIQTWGINFSGLLHIGANLSLDFSAKNFKENTLIFQMSGGYFCSYDKLKLQNIPKGLQIAINYKNSSKSGTPSKVIPIDNKQYQNIKESKSVSPSRRNWRNEELDGKFFSKSHSPPNVSHFRHNNSDKRLPNRFNNEIYKERTFNDSIYEHSPKSETVFEIREYSGSETSKEHLKSSSSLCASNRDLTNVEESEAAENYDNNSINIPKIRYLNMDFLKSEIRPSYTAKKLQKLHLLQFSIKNKFQAVQEIKEKIYEKCAIENIENILLNDIYDYENFSRSENLSVSCREFSFITGRNKHLKTKIFDNKINDECKSIKFNKIVNDNENSKQLVKPTNIIKNNDRRHSFHKIINNSNATDRRFTLPLNKLLEFKTQPSPSQRMRHAFLTKQVELSRFKRRLLIDERDSALVKIRRLKEIRAKLSEENQDNGSDLMQKYHSLSKKWDQLKELHKSEAALHELCAESTLKLQTRRWQLVQDIQIIYPIKENEKENLCILGIYVPICKGDKDGLRQVPESDLAVGLGHVAHASALAASLLSIPLRHPLRLMGSRTKIYDQLSLEQNEIPLFARNKDSSLFRYGLFLLNRNIAQLLWTAHRFITPNPRNTLGNLMKLLTPPILPSRLELSRAFGSATSIETVGTIGGSNLSHPFSAPTFFADNLTSLQQFIVSSSIVNSHITTQKTSHHSLRSLVALGTDRSTKCIISGGFSNTGGRQFNRFKDSVDGHSPKAAMVIRKRRYSRSVGSYVESLQSFDLSQNSKLGSEPSLLIHDSNCNISENYDQSDSFSEIIENVVSLSESDLTKVSDVTSPETAEGKVIFSVGDDSQFSDSDRDEKQSKNNIENINLDSGLMEQKVDIKNLKLNVNELSQELQQLCSNYSKESVNDESSKEYSNQLRYQIVKDNNIDSNIEKKINNINILEENVSNYTECIEIIKQNEKNNCNLENNENMTTLCKSGLSDNCMNDCNIIDIEKLDCMTYCDSPCVENCPHIFDNISKNKSKLNIDLENKCEAMQDVLVLPSAEAVMTVSSHFTNSLDLMDEISGEPNDLESLETDIFELKNNFECDQQISVNENSSEISSDLSNIPKDSDSDNLPSYDLEQNDCVAINEGNTASRDANELLENIKLIESVEFISSDFIPIQPLNIDDEQFSNKTILIDNCKGNENNEKFNISNDFR